MNFLSPAFLLLGLGAAVPLLLHLLRRRVGNRVDFPALRYLERAEQENRRTMRLRNLLLMLLRVATVLLLSLAAARPIGRMMGAGHAPAAIAILIDNTMSSGVVVDGRSILDGFKRAALEVVESTEPTDNVWLVTAQGDVAGGTKATIRDAIGALSPTSADADLPAAARRAIGLARAASQAAKSVIVFTDGQRTSWPSGVSIDGVRALAVVPDAAPPANHSVIFAEARPTRWSPRGEVASRIAGADSLTYRVTIAGRTLARGTGAPGVETVIRATPPERGWIGGSVDVAPDELAADDIRYFAAWIGPAPSVRATSGAGEFIVAALDALRGSGRIARDGNGIAAGPAEEISSLPALITAPTDPVRLGAANRALERLGVPWRFGQRRVQRIDASMRDGGRVAVADRYELQSQAGATADTVAAIGPDPWLVAGPRYVLVASPLVASATDLPLQASFIPWMASTIADRLSGDPGLVVTAAPGTWVRRPTGVEQLERPDGSMVAVGDSVRVPASAGVYFFVSSGRRSGAIVVNPPARESQLERMSVSGLEQLIPGVVVTRDASQLSSSAFSAASTRSLLSPILIAGLLALLAEALIVARSSSRASGQV